MTLLVGAKGPVVALGYYNYVMMLDESSILIWYQNTTRIGPPAPVRLLVIQPGQLTSLGDTVGDKVGVLIGGKASAEMSLKTVDATEELRAEFPEQLRSMDELLVLCRCSGISEGGGNLALLVAYPRRSAYRLYPQDWFNSGGMDYGYQWVTRVGRNPRTGRVHGEGFRIPPFVLDDSLRQIRYPWWTRRIDTAGRWYHKARDVAPSLELSAFIGG